MDKFATNGVIRCPQLKNDLHFSAAKLVYGTTRRLPAKFFRCRRKQHHRSSYLCNYAEGNDYETASYSNPSSNETETFREQQSLTLHPWLWTTGCRTSDFGTAIAWSSQGHQTWSQNIHYWYPLQAGGNIIGSSKASAHRIFGYYKCYSWAADETLLPLPPTVPTPQPTMRTTQSGRHVHWPDCYIPWTYTFTERSNVEAFIKAPLIRN